jgi:hypothetical protein
MSREQVRAAVRAAVTSTGAAALAFTALKDFFTPGIGESDMKNVHLFQWVYHTQPFVSSRPALQSFLTTRIFFLNAGVLITYFPSVWTGTTTAHTYKLTRETVASTTFGTLVGIINKFVCCCCGQQCSTDATSRNYIDANKRRHD